MFGLDPLRLKYAIFNAAFLVGSLFGIGLFVEVFTPPDTVYWPVHFGVPLLVGGLDALLVYTYIVTRRSPR